MSYYAYLGPLGEVVRHGASFIASKDGFLIGSEHTTRSERLWSPLRGREELKRLSLLNPWSVPEMEFLLQTCNLV